MRLLSLPPYQCGVEELPDFEDKMDELPDNPEYQRKHEQMCEDLESLQDVFLNPDFYFMVLTISAVAIR